MITNQHASQHGGLLGLMGAHCRVSFAKAPTENTLKSRANYDAIGADGLPIKGKRVQEGDVRRILKAVYKLLLQI